MPFVYRYTDNNDGIVKYIGISRDAETFRKRIESHKRDNVGAASGNWSIDYIPTKTMNDAQSLEGHFIAYYETYNQLNTAKKDWGLLSYITDDTVFQWTPYGLRSPIKVHDFFSFGDLQEEIANYSSLIYELKRENEDTIHRLEQTLEKMYDYMDNYGRIAILRFFDDTFVQTGYLTDQINLSDLYAMFQTWCDTSGIDCIDDEIDFEDMLCDRKRISPYYIRSKRTLVGFATIDSKSHDKFLQEMRDATERVGKRMVG